MQAAFPRPTMARSRVREGTMEKLWKMGNTGRIRPRDDETKSAVYEFDGIAQKLVSRRPRTDVLDNPSSATSEPCKWRRQAGSLIRFLFEKFSEKRNNVPPRFLKKNWAME